MAIGYRLMERDQEFLLPPNTCDGLGADHVVWFLLDAVAELDLTAFYERAALPRDGRPARSSAGRTAYDPGMLLTLLVYGYACQERSSR
ncbi:MAG: hypothetical protein LH603_20485 [Pseudonocardia sp.]|nr:hypothetical protein [Pseudonocardia sp.]